MWKFPWYPMSPGFDGVFFFQDEATLTGPAVMLMGLGSERGALMQLLTGTAPKIIGSLW